MTGDFRMGASLDGGCRAGLCGGEGGIRTHGTVPRTQHFQCCQFSHASTSPKGGRRKAEGKAAFISSSVFTIAENQMTRSRQSIAYRSRCCHVRLLLLRHDKRLARCSYSICVPEP